MVGAELAIPNGDYSGASYVVFSRLPDTAVVRTGTGASQNLVGGNFNDTLDAEEGDDRLYPNLGHDTVDGCDGVDTLIINYSASANSLVLAPSGPGTLDGYQGNFADGVSNSVAFDNIDVFEIRTGSGSDTITGGTGNDRLNGGTGADTMIGGDGNDLYFVDNASDVVTEADSEGTDEVRTSLAAYTLSANVENLTGTANSGQTLTGNVLANTITAGAGNDTLDGGGGDNADVMIGGLGNDVYVVDNVFDVVAEFANQGIDEVSTSLFTYTLGGEVENLTGTANTGQVLTGNDLANTIKGGGGADALNGGEGDDTLIGGAGADELAGGAGTNTASYAGSAAGVAVDLATNAASGGDAAGDTFAAIANLTGSAQADMLSGDGNANTLDGGSGDDVLFGAGGDDTLIGDSAGDQLYGSTGNDTYVVHNASAGAFENAGEGTDTVEADVSYVLGSHVENLTLTGAGTRFGTGNNLDNTITGNADTNVLFGAGGNDTLIGNNAGDQLYGSTGNDTYVVHDASAGALENAGEGADTVLADVSYAIGSHIENLTLTGTDDINGTGNNLDNAITGNEGANVLDGGSGEDILFGGGGDDTLIGNSAGDQLYGSTANDTYVVHHSSAGALENAGEGTDTVLADVSYALGSHVEILTLTGAGNINGTGNGQDNTITGNTGNNALDGGGGADVLDGGAGADTMIGGAGNDTLNIDSSDTAIDGGADTDTAFITGGTGVTLNMAADNLEIITDNVGGADTINGVGTGMQVAAGGGNDTIGFTNSAFTSIDGGAGLLDRFVFKTAGQSFDLTANISKVTGIEIISLSESAGATLTLTNTDIPAINPAGNQLYVTGGADDSVTVGDTWVLQATGVTNPAVSGDTFNQYHNATTNSDLFIADTIALTIVI